jgi:hypothetical protein
MSPSTLFGAPTHIDSAKQQWWIRLLTKNWLALMGRPPHLLEADLEDIAALFANGASLKNLKARIYALPEADAETKQLPPQVVLIVDGCALVTPDDALVAIMRMEAAVTAALKRIGPDPAAPQDITEVVYLGRQLWVARQAVEGVAARRFALAAAYEAGRAAEATAPRRPARSRASGPRPVRAVKAG